MPRVISALFYYMQEIVLLGSTGSIGTQTLDVCRKHSIKVKALSANTDVNLIEQQAREFSPEYVCMNKEQAAKELKIKLADTGVKVLDGIDGMCFLASLNCDKVVNAVVGMIGLQPTLSAIKAHNTVALANKETMVVGGEIVNRLAKENDVSILPIDSEHSAIFQSLMGNRQNKISKIILTASGGPFYGYNAEMLKKVTKAQALNHPNWVMGNKITIDSATMMNKGLELIEAVRLFDVTPQQVEIVIHRQSVIHSGVEYEDGSIIAQLGVPDMRIPIQFALTYPNRLPSPAKRLSLFDVKEMSFARPDKETFMCLNAAEKAISYGGNAPCIINAANEAAVALFLGDKISFSTIGELVSSALMKVERTKEITTDIIFETEKRTREFVLLSI